jgi:hypothetical protein
MSWEFAVQKQWVDLYRRPSVSASASASPSPDPPGGRDDAEALLVLGITDYEEAA